MNVHRSVLSGMICLALLASCANATPGPGGGSTSTNTGSGGGTGASPGASFRATPGLGPPAGSVPPPLAGAGIQGTITLHAERETSNDVIHQVIKDSLDVTVDVRLVLDAAAGGETYVDAGSRYTVNALTTTEHQLGDCMATSETRGNANHAFADQPTSMENEISATVERGQGIVLINVRYSWGYDKAGNACEGSDPYSGENAAGLDCPFFGLSAKLIEGSATDQIDTTCQLPGGETISGLLTLTR